MRTINLIFTLLFSMILTNSCSKNCNPPGPGCIHLGHDPNGYCQWDCPDNGGGGNPPVNPPVTPGPAQYGFVKDEIYLFKQISEVTDSRAACVDRKSMNMYGVQPGCDGYCDYFPGTQDQDISYQFVDAYKCGIGGNMMPVTILITRGLVREIAMLQSEAGFFHPWTYPVTLNGITQNLQIKPILLTVSWSNCMVGILPGGGTNGEATSYAVISPSYKNEVAKK